MFWNCHRLHKTACEKRMLENFGKIMKKASTINLGGR